MKLKSKYFKENFMSMNPTVLDKMVNSLGQSIKFLEHPVKGDDDVVYALIDEEFLVETPFFECDDMMESHEEYTPFIVDGEVVEGYSFQELKEPVRTLKDGTKISYLVDSSKEMYVVESYEDGYVICNEDSLKVMYENHKIFYCHLLKNKDLLFISKLKLSEMFKK